MVYSPHFEKSEKSSNRYLKEISHINLRTNDCSDTNTILSLENLFQNNSHLGIGLSCILLYPILASIPDQELRCSINTMLLIIDTEITFRIKILICRFNII